MIIPTVIGVNPLQTTLLELGIVSGRVALLLRSAEIQPVFDRFVTHTRVSSPPSPSCNIVQGPCVCADCAKRCSPQVWSAE